MRANALPKEIEDEIAAFTHDPLGFVLYAFDWNSDELKKYDGPREWQRAYLERLGERLRSGETTAMEAILEAVASGHGVGKSCLVAWLILWALSTFEDTRGVVTANTESQLKDKTWAELSKWHRLSINRQWFTCTATAIYSSDPQHEKTWRIDQVPWTEHKTEAFAGLHNQGKRVLLIFDEASAIPDKIWEVSEGALTDEGTEILWLVFGNPTRNTGRFRDCFSKLRHRWGNTQLDSRTVEGTNRAQIEKWIEDYGVDSDFVKVRVRGLFPSASFRQFISTDDVDQAYGRELLTSQYEWAPKILTVDPAWEGDDEFVISMRQGLKFEILKVVPKNDNDVLMANIVARIEDEEKADAVFVDGGFGTGIVSVGRTLNRKWQIVWFSEKPFDEGCLNKRAEMWKLARDWLKDGGSIPKDPVLRDDLIGPEVVPRLDGKLQLESKKDMKERGVLSPNRGDSLALSFAFPIVATRSPRVPESGPPRGLKERLKWLKNGGSSSAGGPYD